MFEPIILSITNHKQRRRLLNFKPAVWLVVLVVAIIGVAFLLSILPQQIVWVLFILFVGGAAFLAKSKT
jgi:hypothetical protein